MFLRLAVLAVAGMATATSTAAAGTHTPGSADNIWAAIVVLGMVTALLLVTLLVSPRAG